MYKYKFPIGDWSKDGHGECDWYLVSGNLPIESVREAHFKSEEIFGFSPGEMCSDYQEPNLNPDIIEKLTKILDVNKYGLLNTNYLDSKTLLQIWLDILNHTNPMLELKVIKDDFQTINFYGHDSDGRHLDTPGYGLFDN